MFASIMARMGDECDSQRHLGLFQLSPICVFSEPHSELRHLREDVPWLMKTSLGTKGCPVQRDKHLAISSEISQSSCRLINGCWFSRRASNRFSHSSRFLLRRNLSITHYFTSHYHPKWELGPIKWKFGRNVNKRSQPGQFTVRPSASN